MTAPTCPINRSQPTQRPFQPPGIDVAAIPRATTLITVIDAINQMTTVINKLTVGEPQVNNAEPPLNYGYNWLNAPPPPGYATMNWVEISRSYTDQKVINPEDPDQFIEIKTLSEVIWQDSGSGHQLIYQANG